MLPYTEKGVSSNLSLSSYLRRLLRNHLLRMLNPLRFLTDAFDHSALTAEERETYRNTHLFREYLRKIIAERRADMTRGDFVSKGDFLTQLLQNEVLAKDDDEYIVDECFTFMIGSS